MCKINYLYLKDDFHDKEEMDFSGISIYSPVWKRLALVVNYDSILKSKHFDKDGLTSQEHDSQRSEYTDSDEEELGQDELDYLPSESDMTASVMPDSEMAQSEMTASIFESSRYSKWDDQTTVHDGFEPVLVAKKKMKPRSIAGQR